MRTRPVTCVLLAACEAASVVVPRTRGPEPGNPRSAGRDTAAVLSWAVPSATADPTASVVPPARSTAAVAPTAVRARRRRAVWGWVMGSSSVSVDPAHRCGRRARRGRAVGSLCSPEELDEVSQRTLSRPVRPWSGAPRGWGSVLPGRRETGGIGLWRSLVAHLTGGQGVAGSNPVSPTTKPQVRGRVTARRGCTSGPLETPTRRTPMARRTKRTDGRYAVIIRIEQPDGTRRRSYFYGRTQAEAQAKADQAQARVAAGGPVRDANQPLAAWLDEWAQTFLLASDRAPSTKTMYAGLMTRHVVPVIGHLPLAQVRPTDITRVLLAMEQARKSASTRRNAYAALRSALDDAVVNGLLAVSPVVRVKRPRAEKTEALSLDPVQVSRFLVGAQGLRYRDPLRVILGTGVRRGEVLALRWSDLDLERAEARVTGSLVRDHGRLVVSRPKTNRSRRVIALSPAVIRVLGAVRAAQAAERLRAANLWNDTGFVFTTELGLPVDPRNLLRTVKLAAQRSELPEIGVHTLRHTYATTALLNGIPLHVVSRNLGHSSTAITADIYGHLTDEAARAAAAAVSDALQL
ncbi:hypothetical protein LUZ63_020590 [Rhynchospora breviuscula]|uniref:Site-specific integrase n=1 Tax=Rhynchospora breviuscula TaxID=2022672 RepID=A0A9P9Z9X4_9POAL|nr:hypothetical protein LUZ63_020590 [Rhynchospora breviuscula]